MPAPKPDSAVALPLARPSFGVLPGPSHLEEEIIGLFDVMRRPLLRYVFSLGLSPQDGEDIVQEVFLLLFQHVIQERSRRNLRGWIFRVAHNLALKHREAVGRAVQNRAEPAGTIAETQSDPRPNPEEQVAHGQRQQRLLAVLRVLSEQDQRCLFLRAEGLRYREIGHVLGISLGAVSISLTRSLGRLGRADER